MHSYIIIVRGAFSSCVGAHVLRQEGSCSVQKAFQVDDFVAVPLRAILLIALAVFQTAVAGGIPGTLGINKRHGYR